MKTKMMSFEFIRALSIVLILVAHSSSYFNWSLLKYLVAAFNPFLGKMGLSLFMFISGYLLYINNNNVFQNQNVLAFYKKRILRIYPLYWIALITFTFTFIYLTPFPDAEALFGWNNLAIHAIGLQILLAPTHSTPIFTLYFIGIILLYYSIYPFVNSKSTRKLIAKSILVFIFFFFVSISLNIVDTTFFSFYPIFIFGIISAKTKFIEKNKYDLIFAFAPVVLVALVVLDDRIFMFFDQRISITAISAGSGVIESSMISSLISPLTTLLNVTTNTIKSFISFISSTFFSIVFCTLMLLFTKNITNDSLAPHTKTIISNISYCSYALYLFHRPFLSIFSSMIYSLKITPIIKDGMTIFIAIPLIYIFCYYVQKIDFNIMRKLK